MNLSRRYLAMLAVALVPTLHGCLWESIHVDGRLDASSNSEEPVENSTDSLKSEEDTNEETT